MTSSGEGGRRRRGRRVEEGEAETVSERDLRVTPTLKRTQLYVRHAAFVICRERE